MKIKEFYENMKDIIDEPVTIVDGVVQKYSDYMKDKKVFEYLYDFEIKSIYIGNDKTLIVEI